MPNYLTIKSNLALFEDDSKLYRPMTSINSQHELQADLHCLNKWSKDHSMPFNSLKCKTLRMSRKRSSSNFAYNYQLEDHQLECVTNIRDLGITISNNLSWELHIEKMCVKANKILGLVKRVCGCDIIDIRIRKLLYISLVRPKLEYASNIWSPYTVKHRRLIDMFRGVQPNLS